MNMISKKEKTIAKKAISIYKTYIEAKEYKDKIYLKTHGENNITADTAINIANERFQKAYDNYIEIIQ